MRPDPGLGRQRVRDARPVAPLVVERDAGVDHRSSLRQEDVLDRPVEAAGCAEPGHVPASLHDLRFGAVEHAAPVDRGAIRAATRLVAVENLEAAQHPGALLAAGAEWPAAGDTVATVDRYGPAAPLHGGAGDGDVAPVPVDLLDTRVRQTERDELGDIVVAEVPADRAGPLGQQLDRPQICEWVGLQAAQLTRSHEPVEAGRVTLLDQRLRQALLTLELVVMAADDRPQRGRGPHRGLSLDVGR